MTFSFFVLIFFLLNYDILLLGDIMNFNLKKKILSIISIISTIICCFYLGKDIVFDFSIKNILIDIFFIILSFLPFISIHTIKRFKHLYYLLPFYGLLSFIGISISTYILGLIGIIICFIESNEEKGILVKLLKRHPLLLSLTIILSGVSFLSLGSVFEFFSELTYGFNMLGELFGTIFLFFMIIICKKGYLIYRNKGSILEAISVSLPFIIYSLYIGCSLFGIYFVEGYELVSIDNIIVIVILYLLVGVFEDFLTRGLALNILLDKFGKTKKGIWLSIFLSSLFFGLIHFVNIFTGASLKGVLIQVITATCIGMYFAAIYLRSGSVWAPALLHGFYDIAASVSSFFVIKEVVDVSGDYGEAISNYSWGNLVVGVIFVFLTLFLLRKSRFSDVYNMVNDKEINKNKDNISSYVLIGISLGFGLSFCFSSLKMPFQLKEYAYDLYDNILISTDYQNEYGTIYKNGYFDYESINDEVKILMAVSNMDKLDKVEENVVEDVVTYIEDYEIEKELKEIFNKDEDINYVDFKYSYKTSCSYEEDALRYKCITTNNDISSNLRIYSNIDKISLSGESTVQLSVYYLVEDLSTNTIYADSDLKTVYRYNTKIEDISDGIIYKENSDNKEFWDKIKENNKGMVPTYTLSMEISDLGDHLYLVSSEFNKDSISNSSLEIEKIDNNLYKYKTSNYTFIYDSDYFKVEEINNYLVLKYKEDVVLKIEIISSEKWLDKYKNVVDIKLGNYNYSNINNDYLIYKNNFYMISINTDDMVLKNKLLEIISTIDFS